MNLKEFSELSNLKCLNPDVLDERKVSGVFVGDLLSWVMGNAKEGQIWITVQGHLNVIAVAVLKEMPAIILSQSASFDEECLAKASEEKIAVFTSELASYECAKICAKLGL